jgi:hypothetical protein
MANTKKVPVSRIKRRHPRIKPEFDLDLSMIIEEESGPNKRRRGQMRPAPLPKSPRFDGQDYESAVELNESIHMSSTDASDADDEMDITQENNSAMDVDDDDKLNPMRSDDNDDGAHTSWEEVSLHSDDTGSESESGSESAKLEGNTHSL